MRSDKNAGELFGYFSRACFASLFPLFLYVYSHSTYLNDIYSYDSHYVEENWRCKTETVCENCNNILDEENFFFPFHSQSFKGCH